MYCEEDGTMSLPFPHRPHCQDGEGTFHAINRCSESVAFCQTVLPGYEDMLIPTPVDSSSRHVLAVPGSSYWAGSASQYVFLSSPST